MKRSSSSFLKQGDRSCQRDFTLYWLVAQVFILLILIPFLLAISNNIAFASQDIEAVKEQSVLPFDELNLTTVEREFLRSNPVIRVANEMGWEPFDFNEYGTPRGYAIDFLDILGKKLGISFEYVHGYSWADLLDLFKKGEIDLLPCLWISESRKNYMLFTRSYLELPYVLVASRHNEEVKHFQDLKGKTVAVARGYKQEEVLRNNYPEINLHLVKNVLEGLKAVNYGKADAYIGYRGTVDYLIASRLFTSLSIREEITSISELGPQGLHLATNKHKPILRSIMQKAMDSVSDQEKLSLARKWIIVEKNPFPDLTDEEKLYLRDHTAITVNNLSSWPPFNFNEGGKPKGFCVDYMRLLGEKLGLEINFISGPSWNEYLSMIKDKKLDLLCDVVETPDRHSFLEFTPPYFVIFSGIVTKKENNQITGIKDLSGKNVVVPQGFYYQEILKKHYPKINIITRKNTLECLKAVSFGDADAALAEKPVFDHLITKHFLSDLRSKPIINNILFENTPVSIGVAKGNTTLLSILEKTMDVVSDQEVSAIKEKWLGNEIAHNYDTLKVTFSAKERDFLAGRDHLRTCADPSWLPFEQIDNNGVHKGIIADVLALIARRISMPFEVVATDDFNTSLQEVKNGNCDILTGFQIPIDQTSHFVFSKPYMESVGVIVTGEKAPYIQNMETLVGKKVTVLHDDAIEAYIKGNFPGIVVDIAPSVHEALLRVKRNQSYAVIAELQTVSYNIYESGLYDLKIAGQTPFKYFFKIAIPHSSATLKPIIDKAVDSISTRELSQITQKWLSIKYEYGFNYRLFWQILGILAIGVAVIVYWNIKLSRLNRTIAVQNEQLEKKGKELKQLSITDSLTGLYNRMHLNEQFLLEHNRSLRHNRPLSIIMLDIDQFKKINDSYGHLSGDLVLEAIAETIQKAVRQTDILGRWGGEEFLIICPETTLEGAKSMAEKLRKVIREIEFPFDHQVSASFGVSKLINGQELKDLISLADKALYKAKKNGRNRVECLLGE
jgi:diguanylate cyclase (GGDEF)-like protein